VPDAAPLRVHVPEGSAGLRAASDIIVDQLMAAGHDRFRGLIGELPDALRDDVRAALREFLNL
jgi:mRNA-degrading endonuclease toxin of MazEF toxin-antitoxin module